MSEKLDKYIKKETKFGAEVRFLLPLLVTILPEDEFV